MRYLDLFAGAGGLSEGFIKAGFEPVAHVELSLPIIVMHKIDLLYRANAF